MGGRRKPRPTDDEALAEYRMRERIERGEKVAGQEAGWLDRRGPAANAALRADAQTRHSHVRQGNYGGGAGARPAIKGK